MRTVLILEFPGDSLAECVASFLASEQIPVVTIEPDQAADFRWTIRDGQLKVDGQFIGGILLRCPPNSHYSSNFTEQDQKFADTEMQALLLAVSNLPSVLVVNCLGPVAFFDDSVWNVWRSLLKDTGAPLAPLVFGNIAPNEEDWFWLPHLSCELRQAPDPRMQRVVGMAMTKSHPERRYLLAGDAIIPDDAPDPVNEAKKILRDNGLELAELTVDTQRRILAINPLPLVDHPEKAAEEVCKVFNDYLRVR